jgi:hypothetical protein
MNLVVKVTKTLPHAQRIPSKGPTHQAVHLPAILSTRAHVAQRVMPQDVARSSVRKLRRPPAFAPGANFRATMVCNACDLAPTIVNNTYMRYGCVAPQLTNRLSLEHVPNSRGDLAHRHAG